MNGIAPTNEVLNRAFGLAYFILGDRTASIYVAMAAIDRLKTASSIQERRLSYTPTGRSSYPAARTKLRLSHTHLLQRLIYIESEPFERLLEGQEQTLQQQDMIIRFIKHLVRAATKRNSFYVALGLCRLLHNYTTSETTEIYSLVMQDPDRGRDDYYYRSRKKHLLQELKERFDGLLKSSRGFRGEERFQSQEDSASYLSLVKECLFRFTPWDSSCVLPDNMDPARTTVNSLLFKGEDPDEEHAIELNRIHTLLHPECFERLIGTLGLDAPERRLELPYFFISSDDRGPTNSRLTPQELSEGELDAMRRYLEKNVAQRKDASGKVLSILIDGDEQACFEVGQTSSVQINVGADSELIEVRSVERDEEVPLAIHLLSHNGAGVLPPQSSVTLGSGQGVTFAVQPQDDSPNETGGTIVNVIYSETSPIRLLSLSPRRLKAWFSDNIGPDQFSSPHYLKLALGSLLIAIFIGGFLIYLHSRKASPDQQLIAEQKGPEKQDSQPFPPVVSRPTQPPAEPEAQPVRTPSPEARAPRNQPRGPRPLPPASEPGVIRDSDSTIEATRGRIPERASAMLLTIKRVYLDPMGDESLSRQVREMLIQNLQASSRFIVVEKRGEADAVFKGSARRVGKSREVSVALRLVNAKGQVVWSTASKRHVTAIITNRLIRDLLADIERLEGKR